MARTARLVTAGLLATVGCGVVVGLVALAAVAAAVAFVVAGLGSFEGCDVELSGLGGYEVAMTRGLDGSLQARPRPCAGTSSVQTVVLVDSGMRVRWSAHREAGAVALDSVTVGRVPDGFVEDRPLGLLRDGEQYRLLLSPLDLRDVVPQPTSSTSGTTRSTVPTTTLPDAAVLLAGHADFRPEQVDVGRYLFQGSELTPEEFRRQACN